MLTGQDILCFSSIDWDFVWQGHQEIMSALAAAGNRVLFVENTGVRAPALRDLPRLRQRLKNWFKGTKGFRQVRPNLVAYAPVLLPFPYSRLARRINRWLLLCALQRWMRATHVRHPVIWTFLPTQLVVDAVDRLDPSFVIYYCIADFAQLTPKPREITRTERQLIDRADLVFVQNEALRKRCEPHANMHIFPFGVKLEAFRAAAQDAPELAQVRGPIVGYVGGIHRHIDFGLIERIAHSGVGSVVMVGPLQADVTRLEGLGNVHFVGAQPHSRIAEFIRRFDVGIIPYALTEYTRTVFPTKLNEYLAMGLPVVATKLPEVCKFVAQHGNVVTVAEDDESFIRALKAAIAPSEPLAVKERMAAARRNSWEARIAQMSSLIEEGLNCKSVLTDSWQGVLGRLYRRAKRQAFGAIAAIVAIVMLLFYSPLLWWIAEPLRMSAAPARADAIVVFAGGVGESGKAGGGYQERVNQAVNLYREQLAPRLIFSSGYTFVFHETEVMKHLAMDLGVPESAIILDTHARNTYENVVNTLQILRQSGCNTILLVSSPYHMRRGVSVFRKLGPDIKVIPAPVPYSQFYARERVVSVEQIHGILSEYAALIFYWWRGWV